MGACRLLFVFWCLQVTYAFRMKRASRSAGSSIQVNLQAQKFIGGVLVHNYDVIDRMDEEARALSLNLTIKNNWILMLRADATETELATICRGARVECSPEGHAGLTPFVEVHGTEQDVKEILEGSSGLVDFIEPDAPIYAIPELPTEDSSGHRIFSQTPWGLDRIGKSADVSGGAGVHVYILDTGIRTTHSDFGGRAVPTLEYLSTSPKVCNGDVSCAADKHGHGTHCAGTVGGLTYGVATEATLHAVKVLSDSGSGSTSYAVGAIDWIVAEGKRPAVISMSLGGMGRSTAYQRSIDMATSNGVIVVVAAGNNNADACSFSPAYVPSAITVGSTTDLDSRSSFSNYGHCVDLYAPGTNVKSAGHHSDSASATMSGTSMACPHVSGAAALILEENSNLSPSQVRETLANKATSNAISGLSNNCPNKLLWVGENSAPTPAPTSSTTPCPLLEQAEFVAFDPDKDNSCDRQPCSHYGIDDPFGSWCKKMACSNLAARDWCSSGGHTVCGNECGLTIYGCSYFHTQPVCATGNGAPPPTPAPSLTTTTCAKYFDQSQYVTFDWSTDNSCERQPCQHFGFSDPYGVWCKKMACANTARESWCSHGGKAACGNECDRGSYGCSAFHLQPICD